MKLSRRGFLGLLGGAAAAAIVAPAVEQVMHATAPLYIPAERLDMGVPHALNRDSIVTGLRMSTWADDTAHLQALLDRGGDVQLPTGTFRITRPLTMGSNTHLTGPGTVIKFEGQSAVEAGGSNIHVDLRGSRFDAVPPTRVEYGYVDPVPGRLAEHGEGIWIPSSIRDYGIKMRSEPPFTAYTRLRRPNIAPRGNLT